VKTSDCKNSTRAQTRINHAWATAEYSVYFGVCGVPCRFLKLSRKRLRHQLRQYFHHVRASMAPHYWPELAIRGKLLLYK
jgi:hypothetical protein